MDKFYISLYNLESDEAFEQAMSNYMQIKKHHKDVKIVLAIDLNSALDDKIINNSIKRLQAFGITPQEMVMSIVESGHHFSSAQWREIKSLNEALKKKNILFGFEDLQNTWSVEEVERANNQIIERANGIKKKKLTPFEKLLSVYLDITHREYIEESEEEHFSSSRSVYGVLNKENIVCVGYSNLLKAIMSEIADENIKVYINNVAVSYDNKSLAGYHQNLIIYIKDDKYGIDGYYYLDPTWDNYKDKTEPFNLEYFMVPLADISKMNSYIRDNNADLIILDEPRKRPNNANEVWNNKIVHKLLAQCVSFSSDRFGYSVEFLKDFARMHPEFVHELCEEANIYQLIEALDKIESAQASLKSLEHYQFLIIKSGLSRVGASDLKTLKFYAEHTKTMPSDEELMEIISKMKQKYEDPELYENAFMVMQSDMYAITDYILGNEQDELKRYLQSDQNDPWLKEEIIKKREKIELIKTRQAALPRIIELLRNNTNFYENLPYYDPIAWEEQLNAYLYAGITGNEYYEAILKASGSQNIYSHAETPSIEEQEKIQAEIKNRQSFIDFVSQGSAEFLIINFAQQILVNCSEKLRLKLVDSSVPVNVGTLSRALQVVLAKQYPNYDDKTICQMTQEIIEYNCTKAMEDYSNTADNGFIQMAMMNNPCER